MQRVKLRPWMLGVVVGMLALGVTLTSASPVERVAAQPASMPGEAIFIQNCSVCHGLKAQGRIGPPLNQLPPEIANVPAEALAPQLTQLIRSGIPGRMPRFTPDLVADDQVLDLTKYLISLNNTLPGPSFYEAVAPITADKVAGRTYFAATQHSVGGEFATFWRRYGGLRVFGMPVTEEYMGISPEDGQPYTMQMFERARFELHPNAPAGQRVQLALLGAEDIRLRTHFVGQGGEQGGPPEQSGASSGSSLQGNIWLRAQR